MFKKEYVYEKDIYVENEVVMVEEELVDIIPCHEMELIVDDSAYREYSYLDVEGMILGYASISIDEKEDSITLYATADTQEKDL